MNKPPAGKKPLPYSRQSIDERDAREVLRTLRSDWITQGPAIDEFEARFARRVGARHAVAVSSGTAALHAACFAAGLGPGDEAVVPPITFVATANAVLYQGATPVFCDVDPETATMDPDALEERISRKTKAVLPVDFAGHPCDLRPILSLARRHDLVVIEDAAHAFGAEYRGKPVGSIADMTIFSFHPVKHLTTGEGGMITTDRDDLARRLRRFRSHGITKVAGEMEHHEGPWYYEMHDLGFNYRITDFQCALGSSQLRKADGFVRKRRALAALYDRALAGLGAVATPPVRPWAKHSYHLYPIRLRLDRISRTRRQVFESLRAQGLGVQVHYVPVHLQPYYRKRFGTGKGLCPAAEAFYESEISLPLFPRMTPSDVRRVEGALREAIGS
jgi:perosamine synthetase